tara:strand:+ start:60 stop:980 length:921 start_codon:yes stop_codon:yes gene_type:complete
MSRIIFFNTCNTYYQKDIFFKMHKTLERKGQKWELYDGEQYKDCNVAVVFGSTKKHTGKLWKIRNVSHKIKNDIDRSHNTIDIPKNKLVVLETPILGRQITEEHTHFRVGLDHFLPNLADFNWDTNDTRWKVLQKELDLEVKPWRETTNKKYVLLLCQNLSDASLLGLDMLQWIMATVKHLMKRTNRKIVIRNHPLSKVSVKEMFDSFYNMKQVEFSDNSLEKDFAGAHCSIAYTSGASIDSIMAGVPVITPSPYNFVYDISSHDLEQVETPKLGDRQELLNKLAYTQWSVEDIIEGKPLKHLGIK